MAPAAGDVAFRTEEFKGKGRGLVATRKIEMGEMLIDEKPLVFGMSQIGISSASLSLSATVLVVSIALLLTRLITEGLVFDLAMLKGTCITILATFVVMKLGGMLVDCVVVFVRVRLLSAEDRAKYFSLCTDLSWYIPILSEVAVFRSNAVFAEMQGCVCPTTALVNHSCVPNAVFNYDEETGRNQVKALRAIEAGEEITASYIDLWHPTVARQSMLRRAMRFNCACDLCSDTTEESVRRLSDQRRNICGQLERGIPEKLQSGLFEETIKDIKILRDVTREELGASDNLISGEMQDLLNEIMATLQRVKEEEAEVEKAGGEGTAAAEADGEAAEAVGEAPPAEELAEPAEGGDAAAPRRRGGGPADGEAD